MFDRYILASDFKRIEARFSMAKLTEGEIYKPSFNIAPGSKSYVLINSQTRELETDLLYPAKLMNAYPVTTAFTDYTRDDKMLVIPQGEPVYSEFGYHRYKKQKKVSNPTKPTISERAEYTRNADLNP